LAVSKQAAKKFDGERLDLRKLNELWFWKQYQIEITNRFAALENLSDEEDISREHCNELKQHKPWFDEECLGFLD
jgi:hypothetical protein